MPVGNINEVIDRLEQIVEDCMAKENRLGIFAQLYLDVTKLVREGIRSGRFQDGHRMEKFDVLFAKRYLDAYDQYQSGATPTQSWLTAFEACKTDNLLICQNMFLGMNAHINLDLGVAAAQAFPKAELPRLEHDFLEINNILIEQIDTVQDKLAKISPLLFLLDWLGKMDDEKFAGFSLVKARGHAWKVAQRLAALPPADQEREIQALDGYVNVLAKLICNTGMFTGFLIKFIQRFERKNIREVVEIMRENG